ncbi:MAG: stage III sporulation protein AB [Clostridiales bacterium]
MALVFLVVSLGLSGLILSCALGKRSRELAQFSYGFEVLESEISFAQKPLWQCFFSVSQRLNGVVADIFKEVSLSLKENIYDDGESTFSQILEVNKKRLSCSQQDLETMEKFGCNLGLTDKERQSQSIKSSLAAMAKSLAIAEEKEKKWQRLTGFGGWMVGLVFALLLI